MTATWSVTADGIEQLAGSRSSFGYQSRVKPSHTKLRRDALKLKTMRTTIGAKRSA